MKYLVSNDRKVDIIEAQINFAESYGKLLEMLSRDPDSYILPNYMGKPPSFKSIMERANSWNTEDRRMHFAIYENEVVGFCGQKIGPSYGHILQPTVSEMWYAVSGDFRGSGLIYALINESLKSIQSKYVQAFVDSENSKSLNLLKNLGLIEIGLLKENIVDLPKEKIKDDYFLRGLREEAIILSSNKMNEKSVVPLH